MSMELHVDDYAVELGGYRYGFSDWRWTGGPEGTIAYTKAELGPAGELRIPFSAPMAWALLVFALALVLGAAAIAGRRVIASRSTQPT